MGLGGGSTPEFSGPYAAELEQMYHETDDLFVRDIVADSKISDEEIAELGARYTSCMTSQGLYDIELKEGSAGVSYGFPPSIGSERATQIVNECGSSTKYDAIVLLRNSMRTNPQNEDITELIAACLVRHGAVPEGYTAEDYRRDYMQGTYPFTDPGRGQAILKQCGTKPLE